MGALPKNKITRSERGKRRAGNTPSLKRDPKVSSVPLSKRGLVASILAATGLAPAKESQLTHRRHTKKSEKTQAGLDARNLARQSSRQQQTAAVKSTRKTQHKG